MNLENERKAFDIWHLKQFKYINDDLNDDEAEHLYQRVYSHESQDLIRQMEFNAWLSSANREGYKLVPVDGLNKILSISDKIDEVLCGINDSDNIQQLLISIDDEIKAMIGACDD